MELKNIEGREHRAIKKIYYEAFPKAERKPYLFMKRCARRGKLDMLSLRDGDATRGLVFVCVYRDICFIDYLAIDRTCRGGGAGSEMLALIKEKYKGKRIFLEMEVVEKTIEGQPVDNYDERARRKKFYNKNGFFEEGVRVKIYGVVFDLVSNGGRVEYDEYLELMRWFVGDKILSRLNVSRLQ